MAGCEIAASGHHGIFGPERSELGESHLETRSVLSEREARRVSIRHGAQRLDTHQTRWRHTVHAQVRRKHNTIATIVVVITVIINVYAGVQQRLSFHVVQWISPSRKI